jgi:GR25 family glycosyltransferase involved in LPS biosynthesis
MVQIYIIGIKGEYRGYALEESLKALGHSPMRVDSIDLRGSDTSNLGLDEVLISQWNNRPLTSGELGCLRSHQKAWLKFLETENEWSIILEDDAILDSEFSNFFHSVRGFETKKPTILSAYWPMAIYHKKIKGLPNRVPNSQFLKVIVPPYSTVCYAVNRKAVESHFELPYLEITTADWPISTYIFDFFVYKENAIRHSEGVSTISEIRTEAQSSGMKKSQSYVPTMSEKIITFLRNIRHITRALKRVGYPHVGTIIFKRFLYNLYYLQLIHIIPRVGIRAGNELPRHQFKTPYFYLLKNSFPFLRHISKFVYWHSIGAIKKRLHFNYGVRVKLEHFIARFFLYCSRRNKFRKVYVDFISRDKQLVKILDLSQEVEESHKQKARVVTFTCVLNVYNETQIQISKAFFSIVNQTMNFHEIIIYNDGSTKQETRNMLESLRNTAKSISGTRIIFVDGLNGGVVSARNNAARLATSDWVIFLDADDELLPIYLERAYECVIAFPTAEVIYPDYFISKNGQEPVHGKSGPTDISLISKVNTIPHSSFIKLDLFSSLGGYSPLADKIGAEDWELWLRAALNSARFVALNEPGYVYNSGRLNSRSDATDHFIEERKLMIRKSIAHFKFHANSKFKN